MRPSLPATRITSYSAPRLAITWIMRGSTARAKASTRSRSLTLSADPMDATGSIAGYSANGVSPPGTLILRSEEHTSELQSRENLVCRLLLEKKNEQTVEPRRTRHTPAP